MPSAPSVAAAALRAAIAPAQVSLSSFAARSLGPLATREVSPPTIGNSFFAIRALEALKGIALYRAADDAVGRAIAARHNAGVVIGGFPSGFLGINRGLSVGNGLCKLNGVVDICRDIAERGNSLSRSVDIVIFLRARNLGVVLDGDLALSHHYIVVEHIENKDIDAFLVGVTESLVLGNELLVSRKILCRRLGFGNIAVESFDIRFKPCNGF